LLYIVFLGMVRSMNEYELIDSNMTPENIESINKDIERASKQVAIERAEYQKVYRSKNKQALIDAQKRYNERNKDKLREYQREYRRKHKHKIKAYQREYRQRNKFNEHIGAVDKKI
jgi:hypothetical protein